MFRFLVFSLAVTISIGCIGQTVPSTKWAGTIDPSGNFQVNDMTIDHDGNMWLVGSIANAVDFDPDTANLFELNPLADEAAVIAKYDSNGQFLWAGMFDSPAMWSYDDHWVNTIVADDAGNVFVSGVFNGTADFDPDTASSASYTMTGTPSSGNVENDMFLVKLTNTGDFVWAKKIAGTGFVECRDMVLDDLGNIYCTGDLGGTANFNPGSATYNLNGGWGEGIFTAKYSSSGSFIWATVFQGDYRVEGKVIDLDPDGNILLGGWFEEDCDFGPITLDAGWYDRWGYVCKMTNSGTVIYAKPYTSSDALYVTGLKCDTLGNVNLAGYFDDGADLDPDTGTYFQTVPNNVHMLFFTQLDSNGMMNYVNTITTTQGNYNSSTGLGIDENQEYYFSTLLVDTFILQTQLGTISDTFTIGSSSTDYIFKFDHSGNLAWHFGYPDEGVNDYRNLLHVNNSNDILFYSRLNTGSDIDAHPGLAEYIVPKNGPFYGDVFLHRIGQGINSQYTYADSACNYYMLLGDTLDSSAVYTAYTLNSQGCDSTITLNLTVDFSPVISDTIVACDSFLFGGNYLTINGTYYDTLSASIGCDTAHIIDLAVYPTYYSSYSTSLCDSFLLGSSTYYQSGIYIDSSLSQFGCDSVTQVDVSIDYSSDTTIIDTSCTWYSVPGTNIEYFNSGSYQFSIASSNGCDSNITLHFTRKFATSSSDVVYGCSPFTFNGQVYNNSTSVTQVLLNSVGCDSFASTFLQLTQPVTTQQTVQSCGPFVYQGDTLAFPGSYVYGYSSAVTGCDSNHTVNLQITNIDTSITVYQGFIEANQNGALYRWLDCTNNFTPLPNQWNQTINGPISNIAVKITLNGCVDTSRCASTVGAGGTIGMNNIELISDEVTLYPNPTKGLLFIDFPSTNNDETVQLVVYNSEGKVVLEKSEIQTEELQINVQGLSSGVYYLKLVGDSKTFGSSFSVVK